jgi:hypothetical protein
LQLIIQSLSALAALAALAVRVMPQEVAMALIQFLVLLRPLAAAVEVVTVQVM